MSNLEFIESEDYEEIEDISSYKYTKGESESSDDEFDYDEEEKNFKSTVFKLKAKAEESFTIKYIIIVFFILAFLMLSFVFWNFQIEVKDKNETVQEENLGFVFLSLFFSSIMVILISCVLSYVPFTYVNELSEHLALLIVCIFHIVYFFAKKSNKCLNTYEGMEIYIGDILNILLISIFLFAGLKLWTRNITINFNYSIYIDRIRKCLMEDVFLSLFKRKNKTKKIEYLINTFLIDNEMDLSKRRLLFQEFQKCYRSSERSRKKEKYKVSVLKKANSLHFRALTYYKLTYAKDIPKIINQLISKQNNNTIQEGETARYQEASLTYEKFSKILDLSPSYKLDGKGFYRIIKRHDKEKYILSKNLEQMNSALDRVCIFLKFLIILIAVLMLYIKISKELASTAGIISAIFGTQIISNSFSSNAINSFIFLFVIHPYDIGDRIFVKLDSILENLVVAELNVFSTVFNRWDGTCVYVPNSILCNKLITNIRRSGVIADSHKIQINARTDQSKLLNLKSAIEAFLKKHKEDYTEYCMVNYESIENSNKLHMKVYMQYKTNSQNYELYLKRKTNFISFLNRTLQTLNIEYCLPPQRVVIKK